MTERDASWPSLRLDEWGDTYFTLHRWAQILGKIRVQRSPPLNHTWHTALYVTARGLTTSPIPAGERTFELTLDLLSHNLSVDTSDGGTRRMPLVSRTVAEFYGELMAVLAALEVSVTLWPKPMEMEDTTPLDEDHRPASYVPADAERCFRVLSLADAALKAFMGRFQGKQSPTHFFWGSFDLAQTRFSGRPAPLPADADWLRRECYPQEVMSFGFWPGTRGVTDAAFYAYAVPQPAGFKQARLVPPAAQYSERLGEFLLPYEAVRRAESPRDELLAFFQSAYDAGAALAGWDRAALDRVGDLRPRRSTSAPQPPVLH